MSLSHDLISEFVKVTNDRAEKNTETTVYGTVIKVVDGKAYVQIDGSSGETPVTTTTDVKPADRVTVLLKDHSAIVTGNITAPAATVVSISDKVSTEELKAVVGVINNLSSDNVKVNEQLTAQQATIKTIAADNATIKGQVESYSGKFEKVDAAVLTVTEHIEAANAEFKALRATDADFRSLETDFGTVRTLIFGTASGNVIQTSFANAIIAQLGDAQIKSAMIQNISASKIASGDITTNNVRVVSEDGKLLISDETIQISDTTRVRVQIGKDASGDYSINVWDANGKLMLSEGGITDSAIKSAIIRDDMISDTANISAHKIDIDSLFEEINGSDKTIKSTRVYFDEQEQTLDITFKALSSDVESHGTQIAVINGQIESKVWQQDIDASSEALTTKYSDIKQTVDGISSTVSSNTTELSERVAASETLIQQLSNSISMLVTDENGETLMTQTESGWTFSMKETSDAVSALSSELDDLYKEAGDTKTTVEALQQAVTDHGRALEYVTVTTYEGEPCIELGESDSNFKLLITNTRIMFMSGSNVPTYINTNGLVTQNIDVRGEIVQGGYVMLNTSDGGWGLLWKGVSI